MRLKGVLLTLVVAGVPLFGSGWLVGCNSILGINQATLEDAGPDGGCMTNYNDLNCDNYCTLMMNNCSGMYAEYKSREICKLICGGSGFESPGPTLSMSVQPTGANTLGCRIWHANAACLTGEPMVHCPHAGPLGGMTCADNNGDSCIPFCAIDTEVCTGDAAAYGSKEECLADCRPDGGPGSGYVYDMNGAEFSTANMANDTLNCRMYHVENALQASPLVDNQPSNYALHCSHSALAGGGVCVNH